MSVDTRNNAPPSATTSPSKPLAADRLSEQAFLDLEQQRTQAAVAETLEELKDNLRAGLDVRVWTERHPWIAVGVAAASGFIAAAAVKGTRAPKSHEPSSNGHSANANAAPHFAQASTAGYGATKPSPIVSGLFELAKVALQASIMAAGQAASGAAKGPAPTPPVDQTTSSTCDGAA